MEIGGSNHSRTQLMHLLFEALCGEEMVPEKGSLVSKVAIIRNAVTSVSVVNSAEFFLYCLFVIQVLSNIISE